MAIALNMVHHMATNTKIYISLLLTYSNRLLINSGTGIDSGDL